MNYTQAYLEYFNNYLTIACFAEHHGLSEHEAMVIINKGRVLHQDAFGHH